MNKDEVRMIMEDLVSTGQAKRRTRAADMPTAQKAIDTLWSAQRRLIELGWKEIAYAPRDGTPFQCIGMGSTGIHKGYKDEHGVWILDDEARDVWPGESIVLWKPLEPPA